MKVHIYIYVFYGYIYIYIYGTPKKKQNYHFITFYTTIGVICGTWYVSHIQPIQIETARFNFAHTAVSN